MSYIFGTGFTRPNRLTTKKNQDYHRDFGKYCLGVMGHSSYRRFLDKCLINWSFFKGGDGQWIFDEDGFPKSANATDIPSITITS